MASEPSITASEALRTTRAIRRFKPDSIPESLLWEFLDAAIRGPTGGNRQSWGWVVVRDSDTRRKIGEWFREEFDRTYGTVDEAQLVKGTRIEPGTFSVRTDIDWGLDRRNWLAVRHLAMHLAEAPVLVVPSTYVGAATQQPGRNLRRAGASIFGAVQNLMVAARAHGVGSVLTGWTVDRPAFRELLGIPEDFEPMALIPMGYPTVSFSEPKRRPVEDVTHWDRWGEQHPRPDVGLEGAS